MADSGRELRERGEEDVGRALLQKHLDDVVDLLQRLHHLLHLHVLWPWPQLDGRKGQRILKTKALELKERLGKLEALIFL